MTPQAQNEAEVTFAPMLKKEDGLIDWSQPAAAIACRVRGLNPWPSAYTHAHGRLLKIHRARVVSVDGETVGGEVVKADTGGFWVATGRGILELEEVQMENRKRLPGIEFLKGARIKSGDRF